MILACPNCSTTFNIPDAAIPQQGRKVKCSSCENVWLATNPSLENKPIETSIAPQPEKKPRSEHQATAQTRYRPPAFRQPHLNFYERPSFVSLNKLFFVFTLVLFICVISLKNSGIILKYADYDPELGKTIRNKLSLHENHGIKLISVDCTVTKIKSANDDNQNAEVEVKIIIENTAKTSQILDVVHFTIFDKDRNNLGNFTMDFMKKLEPGKHEVIEGRLNRIPKSTMFVAIEAGNKIETNIRQINNIFK